MCPALAPASLRITVEAGAFHLQFGPNSATESIRPRPSSAGQPAHDHARVDLVTDMDPAKGLSHGFIPGAGAFRVCCPPSIVGMRDLAPCSSKMGVTGWLL